MASTIISTVYEALETSYTVIIIHFGETPYTEDTVYVSEGVSKNELDYLKETLQEGEAICWKETDYFRDALYLSNMSTHSNINWVLKALFKVDTIRLWENDLEF